MIDHALRHPVRTTIAFFKMAAAFHLTQTHLFQISGAGGPSMLPTFSVSGDVLALDMTARHGRRIQIGDLVLYKIPISANDIGVKRVIGLPGDYVSIGTPGTQSEDRMIQVPTGHCWLVGDNLTASRDSRSFGPLPLALVQGKVVAKVLPWSERQWIRSGLEPVASEPPMASG